MKYCRATTIQLNASFKENPFRKWTFVTLFCECLFPPCQEQCLALSVLARRRRRLRQGPTLLLQRPIGDSKSSSQNGRKCSWTNRKGPPSVAIFLNAFPRPLLQFPVRPLHLHARRCHFLSATQAISPFSSLSITTTYCRVSPFAHFDPSGYHLKVNSFVSHWFSGRNQSRQKSEWPSRSTVPEHLPVTHRAIIASVASSLLKRVR